MSLTRWMIDFVHVRLALAAALRVKLVLVALTPVSLNWNSAARGEDETRRRHYLMGGGDPRAGLIDGDWRNLAIAGALPRMRRSRRMGGTSSVRTT